MSEREPEWIEPVQLSRWETAVIAFGLLSFLGLCLLLICLAWQWVWPWLVLGACWVAWECAMAREGEEGW